MKTRTLILVAVLALAVVTPIVLVFLVPGDQSRGVEAAVMLVVPTVGVILLAYALFQRVAQRGPWEEFWPRLLTATGFLVYAARFIADVPLHSATGMTLALGGLALTIVGILWGARVRQGRSAVRG
jgi:predicted acyltransferase